MFNWNQRFQKIENFSISWFHWYCGAWSNFQNLKYLWARCVHLPIALLQGKVHKALLIKKLPYPVIRQSAKTCTLEMLSTAPYKCAIRAIWCKEFSMYFLLRNPFVGLLRKTSNIFWCCSRLWIQLITEMCKIYMYYQKYNTYRSNYESKDDFSEKYVFE